MHSGERREIYSFDEATAKDMTLPRIKYKCNPLWSFRTNYEKKNNLKNINTKQSFHLLNRSTFISFCFVYLVYE